jgi:predicted DNA-binding transcriptional regulator AlpA
MSTGQIIEHADGGEEDLGDGMELMTAAELAQALHVSVAWVYTQTRQEQIPHIKLRRFVRYRRSTIALWLREREGCAR